MPMKNGQPDECLVIAYRHAREPHLAACTETPEAALRHLMAVPSTGGRRSVATGVPVTRAERHQGADGYWPYRPTP